MRAILHVLGCPQEEASTLHGLATPKCREIGLIRESFATMLFAREEPLTYVRQVVMDGKGPDSKDRTLTEFAERSGGQPGVPEEMVARLVHVGQSLSA